MINEIPAEITNIILKLLPSRDLINMIRVNNMFRKLADVELSSRPVDCEFIFGLGIKFYFGIEVNTIATDFANIRQLTQMCIDYGPCVSRIKFLAWDRDYYDEFLSTWNELIINHSPTASIIFHMDKHISGRFNSLDKSIIGFYSPLLPNISLRAECRMLDEAYIMQTCKNTYIVIGITVPITWERILDILKKIEN